MLGFSVHQAGKYRDSQLAVADNSAALARLTGRVCQHPYHAVGICLDVGNNTLFSINERSRQRVAHGKPLDVRLGGRHLAVGSQSSQIGFCNIGLMLLLNCCFQSAYKLRSRYVTTTEKVAE